MLLYLIEILHQTTTSSAVSMTGVSCILSKFYIKPQLLFCFRIYFFVVSYRNSTSNHNKLTLIISVEEVVSYRNSTSNHNISPPIIFPTELYLIEILHQTTTMSFTIPFALRCILSKFYIKPQRLLERSRIFLCCILSKFYIKPQH